MDSDIAYRTFEQHRAECEVCWLARNLGAQPRAGCTVGHSWLALYYSYRILESSPHGVIHSPVDNSTQQAASTTGSGPRGG